MMDAAGLFGDEDLELDPGDGGQEPPSDGGSGGEGPRGRPYGRRRPWVWPWIALVVALLALERGLVLGVIHLGESWIWAFAGVGVVGCALLITVGGTAFARMR